MEINLIQWTKGNKVNRHETWLTLEDQLARNYYDSKQLILMFCYLTARKV